MKRYGYLILVFIILIMAGCEMLPITNKALYISEVMSSNSGSCTFGNLGSCDYIELFNSSNEDVNLKGYSIARSDSNTKRYVFGDVIIKNGEYLVVCASKGTSEEYISTGFNLKKDGIGLILRNSSGNIIYQLAVPALASDISYCYVDGEYKYCSTPTPGAENKGTFSDKMDELVIENAENLLKINEANTEFIELINSGDNEINLSSFSLSDNISNMSKYKLPDIALKGGELFIVGFKGDSEYHTDFGISDDEKEIYLFSGAELVDSIDISDLKAGMSKGFNTDGNLVYFIGPSFGEKNEKGIEKLEFKDAGDKMPLIINEIMLKNATTLIDEDGDMSPWLELYNSSKGTIDLTNYYISDDINNPFKYRLKTELNENQYLVIFLSGKVKEYHTPFRISKGESVILTNSETLEYQSVLVADEVRLDNVSYGLQNGKWMYFGKGTPGRENTSHGSETIFALSRLDGVWINEVCAQQAPKSKENDWIELYNGSENTINLDGMYISDSFNELTQTPLSGEILPGEYKVITCAVSMYGDELVLSNGNEISDVFNTGGLSNGVTSGRKYGDLSGERVFFVNPTKGSKNDEPIGAKSAKPIFSLDGGFYDSPIKIKISGEGEIHYTLDGSRPTKDSKLYTKDSEIEINKSTSVCAVSFVGGHLNSDMAVSSYIIESVPTLPVVSITIDETDFHEVMSVTQWSRDKSTDIERACHIEYYESDGKIGTEFPCGIRVTGNSTRIYSQKSLGIYLRGGYGQSSVVYPFFEGNKLNTYKSLVLRNAGQDLDNTRMVDTLASELFINLNVDSAHSKFVIVYVNGKYFGLYDLKEKMNEKYFASHYGTNKDNINIIRRNILALAGNNKEIKKVYEIAKGFGDISKYVDEDGWIDYIIARSYTGDYDIFNQKLWRTNDYSVKWRPIFYDCDCAFEGAGANTLEKYFTYDGVPSRDGSLTNMYIPTCLKQNKEWCNKFVERYAKVIGDIHKRSLELFDEMYAQLEKEMPRHIKRWGTPSSMDSWKRYTSNLRYVLENRPKNIVKQIQTVFGLDSARMKELFPEYYE